jgi:hypothetical protein
MAGALAGFNADDFRSNIQAVMEMAAPNNPDKQATFFFKDVVTSDGQLDSEGVPFSPETTVTRQSFDTVKVPVGIEYRRGTGANTSIGEFGADTVVITLLDTDYDQVVGDATPSGEGFEFVVIAGVKYKFRRELMEYALGPVDIHQLLCEAVD